MEVDFMCQALAQVSKCATYICSYQQAPNSRGWVVGDCQAAPWAPSTAPATATPSPRA